MQLLLDIVCLSVLLEDLCLYCLRFASTASNKALGNVHNGGGQDKSWYVIP